jgi:hypothetical protein
MKSCPNHTAWLLVDLSSDKNSFENNFNFIIESNTTVPYEYNIWNNSAYSRLVEIFISPKQEHIGLVIEIILTANLSNLIVSDSAIVEVVNWTMIDSSYAEILLEPFISYLSENETSFQINENTSWGGISSGIEILIVQHYLFISEFWELEISWHVMIAPHDWVNVYLRERSDKSPIWAGMIESWSSGNLTVLEIEPPDQKYR